jgi:ribosomal protein L40E
MKHTCFFGHDWDGCVCRRCGAKAHERSDGHKWELSRTEKMGCSLSSSRGGGQYLDSCYGVECDFCDVGRTEAVYVCGHCGAVKREWA